MSHKRTVVAPAESPRLDCPAWCVVTSAQDHHDHLGRHAPVHTTCADSPVGTADVGVVFARMHGEELSDWEEPPVVVLALDSDALGETWLSAHGARVLAATLLAVADDLDLAAEVRGPSGYTLTSMGDCGTAVTCNEHQATTIYPPEVSQSTAVSRAYDDHELGHVPTQRTAPTDG